MDAVDLSQVFYKITNGKENHNGFKYQDGLNILIEPFNSNPNDSCCAGGFYITNAKNIFQFVNYRCYVREITLPLTDPEFKIIKDHPETFRDICHEIYRKNLATLNFSRTNEEPIK